MTNTEPITNITTLPLESSISYVRVTPSLAQRWLENNENNRRIHEAKVIQYADDMRQGRWTRGADMICFGTDGTLLNGQHRLQAVVRSECTITFAVQRNTPSDAMVNIDTGVLRSVGDVLRWSNEKNADTLAAAAKLAMLYSDGRIYGNVRESSVSAAAVVAFVGDNPELRHSVTVVKRIGHYVDCPPRVIGVAHWIIANANDAEVADHFFHQLAYKGSEPEGSAVLALDRRLREIKRVRASYPARELLALLIKGRSRNWCDLPKCKVANCKILS